MAKKRVAKKSAPAKSKAVKSQGKAKAKSAGKSKAPKKKAAKKTAKKKSARKKVPPMPTPVEAAGTGAPPLTPPPKVVSKSPATAPAMTQAQPKLDKNAAHQRNLKAASMKGRLVQSSVAPGITGHFSARGRRAQARRDSKN